MFVIICKSDVVICFQISIFAVLETASGLSHVFHAIVVICFQISIFAVLETANDTMLIHTSLL